MYGKYPALTVTQKMRGMSDIYGRGLELKSGAPDPQQTNIRFGNFEKNAPTAVRYDDTQLSTSDMYGLKIVEESPKRSINDSFFNRFYRLSGLLTGSAKLFFALV